MSRIKGQGLLGNVALVAVSVMVLLGAVGVLVQNRAVPTSTSAFVGGAVSPLPPPSVPVSAVIFGDEIVAGANVGTGNSPYGLVLATNLGWRVRLFGYPGSGFTVSPKPGRDHDYLTRLQQLRGYKLGVMLIQASAADADASSSEYRRSVTAFLDAATALLPRTQLVLVGLWQPTGSPGPQARRLDRLLHDIAQVRKLPFVDPIQEQWVTGSYPSSGNAAKYVSDDGFYPNEAGHAYIAQRLERDLRRVLPAALVKGAA